MNNSQKALAKNILATLYQDAETMAAQAQRDLHAKRDSNDLAKSRHLGERLMAELMQNTIEQRASSLGIELLHADEFGDYRLGRYTEIGEARGE